MEAYTSVKGQIVIPASLRQKYNIKTGTKIFIYEEDGRIVLQPVTPEYIHQARGKFKGSGALTVLLAERRNEREG